MDDKAFAEYLKIPIDQVDLISPKKRATYERMAEIEFEVSLYQSGLGEKPKGVIMCGPKQIKQRG